MLTDSASARRPFPANYVFSIVSVEDAFSDEGDLEIHRFPPGILKEDVKASVRVTLPNGREWIGLFADEFQMGTPSIVTTFPNPEQVCVVVDGLGHLIRCDEPHQYEEMVPIPILEVFSSRETASLVLLSFSDIAVYGQDGLAWQKRVSWDGFDDCRLNGSVLTGKCWDEPTQSWLAFEVDIKTGKVLGGCPNLPTP